MLFRTERLLIVDRNAHFLVSPPTHYFDPCRVRKRLQTFTYTHDQPLCARRARSLPCDQPWQHQTQRSVWLDEDTPSSLPMHILLSLLASSNFLKTKRSAQHIIVPSTTCISFEILAAAPELVRHCRVPTRAGLITAVVSKKSDYGELFAWPSIVILHHFCLSSSQTPRF